MDNKLRFKKQTEVAVNKSNRILGLIRRSYDHLDAYCLKNLYRSLVRPLLEYGNPVWPLAYVTDFTLVENVQRRATKLVPALKDKQYEDRLKDLDLPSISYRRRRGDMIEMYKYLHGLYDVDTSFLQQNQNNNRGHSLKLKTQYSRLKLRHDFFSLRIVEPWNSLPESVISAPSINSFKNRLDHHWEKDIYKIKQPANAT